MSRKNPLPTVVRADPTASVQQTIDSPFFGLLGEIVPMHDFELSVVIPIHNEAPLLRRAVTDLLAQLQPLGYSTELILVENGSTDGTAAVDRQLAREASAVRVIEQPEPNYGHALRAGMAAARGRVIVNFDLDYWDVPFLLDGYALVQHRFDIVIGSKNLRLSSDRRSLVRRLVSRVFSFVLRLVFGLRVSDTHGIKVWRHTATLDQLLQAVCFDHHLFDTELIIRGQRAGLRIVELPVEVSETRRPPWGILRRIPRAVIDIVRLRLLLWRRSDTGDVARD
ncbi:MAG: glycosyltransferase [Deltaproteobacteria bacterium]|nr:glycosyltransferase [Deltaproteobacteria bacterium]